MIANYTFNNELQQLWNSAYKFNPLQVPFFTYPWHDVWYKTLGKDYKPYSLIINNEIIAPLAQQGSQVTFSGGDEVADYLDSIGADDKKESAWKEIIEYLRKEGIKELKLNNIPQSSSTLTFFKTLPHAQIEQEDTTPIVMLPKTWDEYVSMLSRKHRHELRRKLRKFESEFSTAKVVVCNDPCSESDRFLDLMKQNPNKQKFFAIPAMTDFFKQIIHEFRNEISYTSLEADGKKVAGLLAFVAGNSYLLYNSGFDREHYSSAGFYLKAKNIELVIERGLKEYNFLQGNDRYKYELGGKDFLVYRIKVDLNS